MAFRSSSAALSGALTASSLAPSAPAGLAQNDIIIAIWRNGGSSNATITWPTGFTDLGNANQSSPEIHTFRAAFKVAGSGEPGSYTISANVNDYCYAHLLAFSGRDTSATPGFVGSTDTNATASPRNADLTGITAGGGDDIVCALGSCDASSVFTFGPPTGYTEREESANSFYVSGQVSTLDNVSAGATGTLTATIDRVISANTGWGGIVISIAAQASTTKRFLSLLGAGA